MSRLLLLMASALLVLGVRAELDARPGAEAIGIFEGHGDVGTVLLAGSVDYDAGKQSYTLAGSGENMWFAADAFHFVWKKVSGDVSLAADVNFLGQGKNPHRKAVLMIRQTLDADSAYADVALHGEGLTSLQYRDEKGAATHEIQANLSAPRRLQLEKRGDYVYMLLGKGDDPVQVAGGSIRIPIHGTYYLGIGVCSHEKDLVEKAVFTNVALQTPAAISDQLVLYSSLETIAIDSTDRHVVYVSPGRFEAPNWSRDAASLLFNRNGHIEKIAVASGTPETIDSGFANRCNNDHGISPDGRLLAVSDQSQEEHRSLVYVLPIGGGTPKRLTQNSPSYWHGWSPDGQTLAFVGERNGNFDIYTIPVTGGDEKRLTTAPGLDDGPDYSPDGKYIYFNSERTGRMQIWRMKPDGSEQTQISSDDYNSWFAHPSPDGKWIVFLSYAKDVKGHPANKDVLLRLMSLSDGKIQVLAKLFGGQGTI